MALTPQAVEKLSTHKGYEVTATDLTAWEEAREEPSLEDLETLADFYSCPVGYFFLPKAPEERLPLDFRGLASEKSLTYESNMRLRQFLSLTDYMAHLARQTEARKVDIGSASVSDDVADIAARERGRLGLSLEDRWRMSSANEVFNECREKMEGAGVFVLSLNLNSQEVRGCSRWDPPNPPAILVNREDTEAAAGRLFTLLHEYAHLVLKSADTVCDFRGREGDSNVEHFANRFAAEVLAPRAEFRAYLQKEGLFERRARWGDPTLDQMRQPFLGASRNVVAILLEELGLAPPGFYFAKFQSWERRRPFGRGKAQFTPRNKFQLTRNRLGASFTDLVLAGHDRGLVSPLELADMLDMKVEKAEEFLSWARNPSVPDRVS